MDRTITVAGSAVILGMALIGFGVWRTAPPTALDEVALPDTWSGRTLERDRVSVALDVKPPANPCLASRRVFGSCPVIPTKRKLT